MTSIGAWHWCMALVHSDDAQPWCMALVPKIYAAPAGPVLRSHLLLTSNGDST